jgi:hypothetical protein
MSEPRETTNVDMYPAIPRLAEDSTSGRAEEARSFSQKNSLSEFFCEKEKRSTMLPQANLPFTG